MKKNIIVYVIYAVWLGIIAVLYGLFLKGLKMKEKELLRDTDSDTVEEALAKSVREGKIVVRKRTGA